MGWMIYTLLGVGIILLIACIIYLINRKQKASPRQIEGMSDFFNIDEYIESMTSLTSDSHNSTIGRYIHIIPNMTVNKDSQGNPLSDGIMDVSQIAVYDMNGNNIALNKPVYAPTDSIEAGSAPPSSIVDGKLYPKTVAFKGSDYIEIDLGDVYQIGSIRYIGKSNTSTSVEVNKLLEGRIRGLVIQVLLEVGIGTNNIEVYKSVLTTSDVDQTVICPNSFNLEMESSDSSISPNNPNLIKFNYAEKEVFSLKTESSYAAAEMMCNGVGATLATIAQLRNAQKNGAEWCVPGWVKDSSRTTYYPLQRSIKSCNGSVGINPMFNVNLNHTSSVNCFGVKPSIEKNMNIQAFQVDGDWSMYDRGTNTVQPYFGDVTISIPDIRFINQYVDYNYLPVNALPSEWWFVYVIPASTNPNANTNITYLPLEDPSRNPFYEMLLRGSGLNFLYEIDNSLLKPSNTTSLDRRINTNIKVFGNASTEAVANITQSLNILNRIYLGSLNDVEKFVNIRYDDLTADKPISNWLNAAYIRPKTGYILPPNTTQKITGFCKSELIQKLNPITQEFLTIKSPSNVLYNENYCSTRITTDMLGLIPDPARNFLINWIYNRTKRFITQIYGPQYNDDGKAYDPTSTSNPKRLLTTTEVATVMNTMKTKLESVVQMKPTVNGQPLDIDVLNKYTLDSIAQAFYETMGGAYIMSTIYDVFTIGGAILDIRFDLTKHGDTSDIQRKIAEVKSNYYTIRNSKVSQDILDTAKITYETKLAELQEQETVKVNPPVIGMVGRFFYTYDINTTVFTITGLILDARAVTSFIPELNGGIYTATGGDPGIINYSPKIKYTMNIPEPLNCSDETTLRRIMEDYVYASENELAKTLKESTPSVDTEKGRIHIKQIIGSAQVSKTQCAITWKETLWDEEKSISLSTDLVRNAIFTYSNAQDDWYSSTIAMNTDGFKFLETNVVKQCKFDAAQFQKTVRPQLDDYHPVNDILNIKNYFIANAFNNALAGFPCNDVIPLYKFNVGDYLSANSDLNTVYNSGDTTNTKGAIDHYRLTGLNENRVIRAQQDITPFPTVITIQQPIPKNADLDNASRACPTKSCDDLSVLFNIVDEYNNDPSAPGAIMLVTKANTANPYQCDLEVNINYDVTVVNSAGSVVQKGSFTYDKTGNETPADKPPPKGIVNGDKLALHVHMDSATCSITYDASDGPGSGTSIMPNTPALYKPLEYAAEVASSVMKPITGAMNTIGDAVSNAVESATSLFSSYRMNTFASVGGIATLGDCPTAKCSDTVNLNAMMDFYKTLAPPDKQINTVLRVGTLDNSTCDITFQEDTFVCPNVCPPASDVKTAILVNNTISSYINVPVPYEFRPQTKDCVQVCPPGYSIMVDNKPIFDKPQNLCSKKTWGNAMYVIDNSKFKTAKLLERDKNQCPISSQTSALRFKMEPGGAPCTFKVKSMSSLFPAGPDEVFDMTNTLNTSACGEVFYVDTKVAQKEMSNICKTYKATVATKAQLTSSQLAGADWCAAGWVVDISGMAYSPTKDGSGFGCNSGTRGSGSGSGTSNTITTDLISSTTSLAGVHCFGTKPDNIIPTNTTTISPVKPFSPAAWNQPSACANTTVNYVNPRKEGFNNYGTPIQIRESTAPLKKMGFGSDRTRNSDTPALNTQYVEPLRQKTTLETAPGPKYIDADDSIKPEKAKSYRYIRFRPIKTRNPNSYEVSVGKFRFFLGPNEIDMRNANVTNPMGTWVGDIGDVVGDGYTNGWSDAHKKALVFSFPYSILINGFTWTTANPDKGVDSDPVQWKLEGSDNGVYWVTLRNQTNHNYPVPKERFQELPIFRF